MDEFSPQGPYCKRSERSLAKPNVQLSAKQQMSCLTFSIDDNMDSSPIKKKKRKKARTIKRVSKCVFSQIAREKPCYLPINNEHEKKVMENRKR